MSLGEGSQVLSSSHDGFLNKIIRWSWTSKEVAMNDVITTPKPWVVRLSFFQPHLQIQIRGPNIDPNTYIYIYIIFFMMLTRRTPKKGPYFWNPPHVNPKGGRVSSGLATRHSGYWLLNLVGDTSKFTPSASARRPLWRFPQASTFLLCPLGTYAYQVNVLCVCMYVHAHAEIIP